MNKLSLKILSLCICAALLLCTVSASTFAFSEKKSENDEQNNNETVVTSDNKEISKDETVYVLAGANGNVKKIIVSDWIKNVVGDKTFADKSDLKNIENVKGNESYTVNADNMKVWDAEGNDIYYQGYIDKELPVNLSVSYKIEGENISAEALAGKSGKVTIRFDYENRQFETVKIDGKNEKIYVPFAMLTGMLLDNDVFKNVEVSGGKLLNDGNRTAVIGVAFPGLQSNLGIDKDIFDIPDCIEITADVTDFSLGMTVTVATNEVFNSIDSDKLNSLDELKNSITKLSDGMNKLIDGSSELYGGLCTLLDKSEELVSGINQLAVGAEELKSGASGLDTGAAALKSGLSELYAGLSQISSNSETLNEGAKQTFQMLLATANAQLAAGGVTVPPLTIENYSTVLTEIYSVSGQQSIMELKNSLDSYNRFYLGLAAYTKGVGLSVTGAGQLQVGASNLKDGTAQLKAGIDQLSNGIIELKNGVPALKSGVSQLKDGSGKLSDGLKQFNKDGIQKLVSVVGDDLGNVETRLKATVDVSKDYKNFSGIANDTDGKVKFIYRTDEIN